MIEYAETENEIISVMEFVKDGNWLEHKIGERKREIKNEIKLKRIAKDILQGIQEIHNKNLIHADIKLENILVTRPSKEQKVNGHTTRAKLCDFGIAQCIC